LARTRAVKEEFKEYEEYEEYKERLIATSDS
jgi:hypothetical protein